MSTTYAVVETNRVSPSPPNPYFETALEQPGPDAPVDPARSAEVEPVDMARLREMVDDDPASMRELIDLYLSESGELMGSLRAAMSAGSATQIEWAAHKLGGSSATCGMVGIVAPLRELEISGRAGQCPENEQLLLEAGRQHERICAYLLAHVLKN